LPPKELLERKLHRAIKEIKRIDSVKNNLEVGDLDDLK